MAEPKRLKLRVSIVMSPERRQQAEQLARDRGLSLSTLLETLVIEEARRVARRT